MGRVWSSQKESGEERKERMERKDRRNTGTTLDGRMTNEKEKYSEVEREKGGRRNKKRRRERGRG